MRVACPSPLFWGIVSCIRLCGVEGIWFPPFFVGLLIPENRLCGEVKLEESLRVPGGLVVCCILEGLFCKSFVSLSCSVITDVVFWGLV